ncbi:hypothetical protein U1Q18_008725 [Sarracenia purpurea var. burkii]
MFAATIFFVVCLSSILAFAILAFGLVCFWLALPWCVAVGPLELLFPFWIPIQNWLENLFRLGYEVADLPQQWMFPTAVAGWKIRVSFALVLV